MTGFMREFLRNVPTANTTVKAAVPASRADVVLGCLLANEAASPITVDVYVIFANDGGNLTYLTKDATLPAGSTLELIEAKLVLTPGDVLGARASLAGALDIVVSYLRQVQ